MDLARLPSDTRQWWTAMRYQLRFYLRTWRFLGLLLLIVVLGGASAGVTIYLHADGGSAAGSLNSGIGNLAFFGIIVGAFIGGDALAMDFGGGTGYFMLVLPVRRLALLLGRYAAAFAATTALLLVFYLFSLLPAIFFWGVAAIPWGALAESLLLALLFGAAVLSTAFFFSSLFRSPAISMVATILILFLGFLFADAIITTLGYEPWFSLLYAGTVIGLVLVGAPHHSVSVVHAGARTVTINMWNPYVWEGALILAAYFVVFLVVSAVIYQWKESKG